MSKNKKYTNDYASFLSENLKNPTLLLEGLEEEFTKIKDEYRKAEEEKTEAFGLYKSGEKTKDEYTREFDKFDTIRKEYERIQVELIDLRSKAGEALDEEGEEPKEPE